MRHELTFRHLRRLIDLEGNETCGFLVGNGAITDIWPTPSLKPSPRSYSIGRRAWQSARVRAAREGVRILGSIHTHPDGPEGPSDLDLELARHLHNGDLRAVWHPRTGRLTIYGREGIVSSDTIALPVWFRLVAPLFFC